ncbi:MAG: hypothetical protein A3G93_08845 [Nitrospinae bacterium RIFCSPLOWO2_12_FULL_45_22]|nr:MAG: hypothetical protein A3G93_08845 [Nitrospinae bacterium RIFCSPLOWO2_12_FULL_45_22]
MKINRMLYISCNSTALGRDTKLLKAVGYILELFQPINIFSHAYHIVSPALFNPGLNCQV